MFLAVIATLAILGIIIPLTIHGLNRVSSQTTENKLIVEAIYTPQNDLIPTTTERLKLALNYYCRKYGIQDKFFTISDIIKCESEWNPDAKNPISSASGIAQFLDSTWKYEKCGTDKSDPYLQLDCMTRMISEGKINQWECWTKYLSH